MRTRARRPLRPVLSALSRVAAAILSRHTPTALVVLGLAGGSLMLWDFTTLSSRLSREHAWTAAERTVETVRRARTLFAEPGASGPLEGLAEQLADYLMDDGGRVRLVPSSPPGPDSLTLPIDDFERHALAAIRRRPDEPFYRFTGGLDNGWLRYAVGDWSGDTLVGLLSVDQPLRPGVAVSTALSQSASVGLAVVVFGLLGLLVVQAKLRRTSRELDQQVLERTKTLTSQAEALEQAKEQYRHLVERSILGVHIVQNGRLVYVNQRMCELLGHSSEALTALPSYFALVPPDDRQHVAAVIDEVLTDRRAHADVNVRMLRQDGQVRHMRFYAGKVDYRGKPALLASAHDITEHVDVARRAQQQRKLEAVGQLAAGIAHEINTPTQFVGDNLEFMRRAWEGLAPVLDLLPHVTPEASSVLPQLSRAVANTDLHFTRTEFPLALTESLEGLGRVATLVRAMKDFSHPGGNTKVGVDLNHAIRTTLTVARNEWRDVAEVVEELAPDLPSVPGLPGELNQVLLNLIVNAAHAIAARGLETKGTITVRTRHDDEAVELHVADSGTGIPEEIRERIFEPFFTTKPVGRGTGQGLAMAQSVITKMHGGTLMVDSTVGRGTTFTIRLPRRERTAPVREAA